MADTKHTPAPWEFTGIYVEHDGKVVAAVWRQNTKAGIANAKLITAAPDLLKALKEVLAEGVECTGAYCGDVAEVLRPTSDGVVERAEAAIAKAEGV